MGTADLRAESGVTDRAAFTRALDELQAAMIVIPGDVVYHAVHLHLVARRRPLSGWLRRRISRDTALREIARCFLDRCGPTVPGELARVTGLSRPEAGLGNRALVAEGFATMLGPGTYRLKDLGSRFLTRSSSSAEMTPEVLSHSG